MKKAKNPLKTINIKKSRFIKTIIKEEVLYE